MGDTILVATHNQGKLEEIVHLLQPFGVTVTSAMAMNLPEPEETGTTFVENARIKSHAAAQATGLPALADDSGLEVAALNNQPGVYTADWAKTSKGRDFEMAMTKVQNLLMSRSAPYPRKARFRCTLVLAWPDGYDDVFSGRMMGQIIWPMRGDRGHGFDPVFQPDGYDQTFGEMDQRKKNIISHRADAFRKMAAVFD